MAKRGTYVYDYSKKQGYLLALQTIIRKLGEHIDQLTDIPPRHSKVIELKDQYVRTCRLYLTLKEDLTGSVNLRVGDVTTFRKIRTDLFPEAGLLKADLKNAAVANVIPLPPPNNLYPDAQKHLGNGWDDNAAD